MNYTAESHDRLHLAELMRDFSVDFPPNAEDASKSIHLRFEKLDIEQFSLALRPYNDDEFDSRFQSLPLKTHSYLYQHILSNAGQYRKVSDPNDGKIFFGLRQQFEGSHPNNIFEGVRVACSYLTRSTLTPIPNVVKFYQQIVHVHPFYDANGRVGRFITSVYLDYHGYHISWQGMRKNEKWLKKLNACHCRMGQDIYQNYLQILVNHWEKFITRKEVIAGFKE